MHGNKKVFGIVNCVYFNVHAMGDYTWCATRKERDERLERKRSAAIRHGLNRGAALSGIYPVSRRASQLQPGIRWALENE